MKLFGIRNSKRRREELQQERIRDEAWLAGDAMLRKTGWHSYLGAAPPEDVLCQFMRPEWNEPRLALRQNFNPALNVYGLYWRSFEMLEDKK